MVNPERNRRIVLKRRSRTLLFGTSSGVNSRDWRFRRVFVLKFIVSVPPAKVLQVKIRGTREQRALPRRDPATRSSREARLGPE